MIRETLRGGDLRLSGKTGSFVFQRLRPGVLLTMNRGRDTGEFGSAPLDVIYREYRLFRRAVEWYFDATLVQNATRSVVEEWTAWLLKHGDILAQMHVLTGSKEVHLMIAIARHFSDSSYRMTLYKDPVEWTKRVLRAAPGLMETPDLGARRNRQQVRHGVRFVLLGAAHWHSVRSPNASKCADS